MHSRTSASDDLNGQETQAGKARLLSCSAPQSDDSANRRWHRAGFFSQAEYEERSFALRSGDCLLLTTDGVTEAANEADEEFGAERVAASALAARGLSANGIRTRIFEDVSLFCNGNFHDDASLIVMTVD